MKRFVTLAVVVALLGAAALHTQSAAADDSAAQKANIAAIERLTADFLNAGKLETLDAVYDKPAIHHSPTGDLTIESRKMVRTALGMAMPDFQVKIESLTANAGWIAALYSFSGTFSGELPTPDGKMIPGNKAKITLSIGAFYRFNEAGLIVESWETYDNLSLSMQMGLLPAPGQ